MMRIVESDERSARNATNVKDKQCEKKSVE